MSIGQKLQFVPPKKVVYGFSLFYAKDMRVMRVILEILLVLYNVTNTTYKCAHLITEYYIGNVVISRIKFIM